MQRHLTQQIDARHEIIGKLHELTSQKRELEHEITRELIEAQMFECLTVNWRRLEDARYKR